MAEMPSTLLTSFIQSAYFELGEQYRILELLISSTLLSEYLILCTHFNSPTFVFIQLPRRY